MQSPYDDPPAASPPHPTTGGISTARDHSHLVVFNVAAYRLGAPAAEVERIIVAPRIRPLPQAPPSIIGVVPHHGQIYRVISLRRKLGLAADPPALLKGQLILTRLPAGLTAFLVDEVEDVLPSADFIRQPLSPHSPMDFFDTFLLRGEQILLHTTFAKMEQARDIPLPKPGLDKTVAAVAASGPPSSGSKAAPDTGPCNPPIPEPAPLPGQDPVRNGASVGRRHAPAKQGTVPAGKTARTVPPQRLPMRSPSPGIGTAPLPARGSRIREAHPVATARPLKNPHRPRRYAVAITALLVLILFVGLGPAFLWRDRLMRREHPSRPDETTASAIALNAHPAHPQPAASQGAAKAVMPMKAPPHGQTRERFPVIAETPPAPARPSAGTGLPPAVGPPDGSPAPKTGRVSGGISPGSQSPREILHLDTAGFTLTVERPGAPDTIPVAPPDRLGPTPGREITHRVVAGDTLWEIAAHYLGNPFQYPELARLSQIRNPDLIYPGDIIRIRLKPTAQQAAKLPAGPEPGSGKDLPHKGDAMDRDQNAKGGTSREGKPSGPHEG